MGGAGWAGGQPLTVVVVIVVKNQIRMILVDLTPARNTAVREASVAAQPWPGTRGGYSRTCRPVLELVERRIQTRGSFFDVR